MKIIEKLIGIATFDLVPTEFLYDEAFYFPDADPFSSNFATCDVESTLFLKNIKFVLIMIVMHVVLVILRMIIYLFRNQCSWMMKIYQKLGAYLYYNGTLRFYMEIFFEVALFSSLNLHTMDWESKFADVRASNKVACLMILFIAPIPPILCVFYCCNKPHFASQKFSETYGSPLDGTNVVRGTDTLWCSIVKSMIFFVRRLVFVFMVIVMKNYLWA